MRIQQSQSARLGQQLRIVPRLIQSMEVLQLPVAALRERITQELESNAALDLQEPGFELDLVRPQAERPLGADDGSAEGFERLREYERSYGEMLDGDGDAPRVRRADGERDAKMDAMANTPSRGETLAERLLHEWRLAEIEPELLAPGAAIIEALDEDGLLATPLEELRAQHAGAGWDAALLERALAAVQRRLEPPGIAARDLRESLLLQIDAMLDGRSGAEPDAAARQAWTDARAIVAQHWDDLLENRLPRIEQRAHLPMARIAAAREALRRLRLSPGREVVDAPVEPVFPDAVVEYDADQDRYVAALVEGGLPVLRVNPVYEQMARDDRVDAPTREFVGTNVRAAEWLIEALHQRQSTVLRVVQEVLKRQRPWFDEGPEALRPLEMAEVADALGVHVGTVSRAVAGKWLQTPRGLVELRRFFSGGTETASGESASWEAVRQMVKDIVDAEDKSQPLSDEAIAAKLKERGVTIARRTVVKYREQLGIPSARHRKVHGG